MAAVHKKHTHSVGLEQADKEKVKQEDTKPEESKTEPVVVSDVVTETTERIELIEEVTPDSKSEAEASAESVPAADPLTDFKEKMTEEEEAPISNVPPKKNFMWPILFIFIIALVMLSGIFVYKNNMKGEKVNVVTLSPTPTVMPQPTKAVDLSQYEIKILNGSSISGEAGRQKSNLEREGFTVSSIGNAADSNYTETIIQAKKDVDQAYLNKLKSVLELSFVVGDSEELFSDADSDVIVILGSQRN